MAKKNLIAGLVLCILAASPLGAATVSFLVIEARPSGSSAANQYTLLWENGLLEVFFESGHIVTKSPIVQMNTKPSAVMPQEAEREFEVAQEGGMDYFLVTVVEYPAPHAVSMRLFSTGSRTMVWEQQYAAAGSKTAKDEYEYIKKAIRDMAVQIQ
jgi:hypothetical protein